MKPSTSWRSSWSLAILSAVTFFFSGCATYQPTTIWGLHCKRECVEHMQGCFPRISCRHIESECEDTCAQEESFAHGSDQQLPPAPKDPPPLECRNDEHMIEGRCRAFIPGHD